MQIIYFDANVGKFKTYPTTTKEQYLAIEKLSNNYLLQYKSFSHYSNGDISVTLFDGKEDIHVTVRPNGQF